MQMVFPEAVGWRDGPRSWDDPLFLAANMSDLYYGYVLFAFVQLSLVLATPRVSKASDRDEFHIEFKPIDDSMSSARCLSVVHKPRSN